MTVLYRYDTVRWSESRLMLTKREFPVIKETPCGAWISHYGGKKFVNLGAKKRYACPTEKEAFESFQARKRKQVGILTHRLAEAKAALNLTLKDDSTYITISELT